MENSSSTEHGSVRCPHPATRSSPRGRSRPMYAQLGELTMPTMAEPTGERASSSSTTPADAAPDPAVWVASNLAVQPRLLAAIEQTVVRAGMVPHALDFSGGWPGHTAIERGIETAGNCDVFVDVCSELASNGNAHRHYRALAEREFNAVPARLRVELERDPLAPADGRALALDDQQLCEALYRELIAWKSRRRTNSRPPIPDPPARGITPRELHLQLLATRGRLRNPLLKRWLGFDPPFELAWLEPWGSLSTAHEASKHAHDDDFVLADRSVELELSQVADTLSHHASSDPLLITGDVGMGKSSALIGLLLRHCRRSSREADDDNDNDPATACCLHIDLCDPQQVPRAGESFEQWRERCVGYWCGFARPERASSNASLGRHTRDPAQDPAQDLELAPSPGLARWLETRPIHCFVDGLDRLSPTCLSAVMGQLRRWLSQHQHRGHGSRMIACVGQHQLQAMTELSPGTPWLFRLHPLTSDRAAELARRWLELGPRVDPELSTSEQQQRRLWQLLRDADACQPGLFAITRSYELLALCCHELRVRPSSDLSQPTALLRMLIEGCTRHWLSAQQGHAQTGQAIAELWPAHEWGPSRRVSSPGQWQRIWSALAWSFAQHAPTPSVSRAEFASILADAQSHCPELRGLSAGLTAKLVDRHGLLRTDATGRICFAQAQFFEFLVASAIASSRDETLVERLTALAQSHACAGQTQLSQAQKQRVFAWVGRLVASPRRYLWVRVVWRHLAVPGMPGQLHTWLTRARSDLIDESVRGLAQLMRRGPSAGRQASALATIIHACAPTTFANIRCILALSPDRELRQLADERRPPESDRGRHPLSGLEFCRIPGGALEMGCPEGHVDEHPGVLVELDQFYIARTPVTNAQYHQFLEHHPELPRPPGWTRTLLCHPNRPVVDIDYDDACKYCSWAGFELPTEAQWEFVRRLGGALTWWGHEQSRRHDWRRRVRRPESESQAEQALLGPPDVAQGNANAFGVFDLAGVVWQWCRDRFEGDAYRRAVISPAGDRSPSRSPFRVLRGGSWGSAPHELRATYRYAQRPEAHGMTIGFRPTCCEHALTWQTKQPTPLVAVPESSPESARERASQARSAQRSAA